MPRMAPRVPCGRSAAMATRKGKPPTMEIPKDFPVKVLAPGEPATDRATCGTCGRSWDDAIATSYTPAPSARCPFEYFHDDNTIDDSAATIWRGMRSPMLNTLREAEDHARRFGKPELADRLYALGCHLGSGAQQRYYTIVASDVGKAAIHAFGKRWSVADFMGRILPGDVSKRVYKVGDVADSNAHLQVESDQQRDQRIERAKSS